MMNMTTQHGPLAVHLSDNLGMSFGMHYVVTRDSKNQEFQAGDRVWMETDGTIMCPEAHGWMAAEDVIEATVGWSIEPDANWVAAMYNDWDKLRRILPPA